MIFAYLTKLPNSQNSNPLLIFLNLKQSHNLEEQIVVLQVEVLLMVRSACWLLRSEVPNCHTVPWAPCLQ